MGRTLAFTPHVWFGLIWSWQLQELGLACRGCALWSYPWGIVAKAAQPAWVTVAWRDGWEPRKSIPVLQGPPWGIAHSWVPLVCGCSDLWKKTIKIIPSWQFSSTIKSAFSIQKLNALYFYLFFAFQYRTMSFLNSSASPVLPSKLLSAEHYHVAALLFPLVMGVQVTGYSINPCNLCPNLRDSHKLWKKEITPKQRNLSVPHPLDALHRSSSI